MSADAEIEIESLLKLIGNLESPRRPYPRHLKTPIGRASKLALLRPGSPDQQERLKREEDERIFAEQLDKLFLLLDHFGIPRTNRLRWFHLAFQLARQHVAGMKITKGPRPKRGRKPQWTSDLDLLTEVTKVRLERKRGTADAIRTLIKREPGVWGKYSQRVLQNRYYQIWSRPLPCPDGDLLDNLRAMFASPTRVEEPE